MRATAQLPENYQVAGHLNLATRKAVLILNGLSLPLLFVFGGLFGWVSLRFNAGLRQGQATFTTGQTLGLLLGLLLTIGVFLILHEGLHGLFFWVYTHQRPKFAFKVGYAYAAAPGWYLPRNQYLIVGLAPVVLLSAAGLPFCAWLPPWAALVLFGAVVINAAGSIGDLVVVTWVMARPANTLVQDTGDQYEVYRPNSTSPL